MSGPMDPERLAELRDAITLRELSITLGMFKSLAELLDDRDHWEAHAKEAAMMVAQGALWASQCLEAEDATLALAARNVELVERVAALEAKCRWQRFKAWVSRLLGGRS